MKPKFLFFFLISLNYLIAQSDSLNIYGDFSKWRTDYYENLHLKSDSTFVFTICNYSSVEFYMHKTINGKYSFKEPWVILKPEIASDTIYNEIFTSGEYPLGSQSRTNLPLYMMNIEICEGYLFAQIFMQKILMPISSPIKKMDASSTYYNLKIVLNDFIDALDNSNYKFKTQDYLLIQKVKNPLIEYINIPNKLKDLVLIKQSKNN